MLQKNYYPFTAIVGQNDIREALILNLINPRIGGLIVNGEKGTAKSTMVRAVIPLLDCPFVEVPVSVSEDCLTGSVNLEKTIVNGKFQVEDGLLSKANGGILYVDEINLLPSNINDILIQTLTAGINRIEREGISDEQESSFVIIGTMNSAEGDMRKQLVDHFGLYAQAKSCKDANERVEIIKRIENFEENPVGFIERHHLDEEMLKSAIAAAKKRMAQIEVTDENLDYIVNSCVEAGVEGHRADIVLVQTALAVAAFRDKTKIDSEDIDEAAYFVFPHRRNNKSPQPEQEEQLPDEEPDEDDKEEPSDEKDDEPDNEPEDQPTADSPSDNGGDGKNQKGQPKSKPQNFKVGDSFKVVHFSHKNDRKTRVGSGKRTLTKTANKTGRYVYATMRRKNNDLALDATIRAAAPYQKFRIKDGVAIAINTDDIREKVRQKQISNLLVFVLDTSGSMGARKRMVETKGAILSLLKDAYVKRDKISLVTFNGNQANVVLPPTNSVERGYRLLQEIETGGKTPLNAGIEKGLKIIQSEIRKRPDVMPMLIVITDGRGNVSIDEAKKPINEMTEICEKVCNIKQINSMVIDIENSGIMNFGIAKKLADDMNGQYYKLEQLKSNDIVSIVGVGRN